MFSPRQRPAVASLVPSDVEDLITAAARAAAAVAQVAHEVTTTRGETLGMSLAGTHGTASWVAESGSYTATDETITQQNMGAFKGGTKIIVSEELRQDEDVALDNYSVRSWAAGWARCRRPRSLSEMAAESLWGSSTRAHLSRS